MTCLHAPDFTLFGKNEPSSASFGQHLDLVEETLRCVSIFKNPWMRSAISPRPFTSKASSIRRTLPNALISKGCRDPFGFSNSSAGPTLFGCLPAARATRCVTSAISRTGSTSARIRFSSLPSPASAQTPANQRTPLFSPVAPHSNTNPYRLSPRRPNCYWLSLGKKTRSGKGCFRMPVIRQESRSRNPPEHHQRQVN